MSSLSVPMALLKLRLKTGENGDSTHTCLNDKICLWSFVGQYDISRYTLTTLSFEVIVEIIKDLDWNMLLRIRQVRLRGLQAYHAVFQTHKLLNVASRDCYVWVIQYHQYTAEPKRLSRLPKPVGSYSADELEWWVLVRRSTQLGWRHGGIKLYCLIRNKEEAMAM